MKTKIKSTVVNIKLKCKECKNKFKVRTSKPELYTDKIKRNWVCLNCKEKEKK